MSINDMTTKVRAFFNFLQYGRYKKLESYRNQNWSKILKNECTKFKFKYL